MSTTSEPTSGFELREKVATLQAQLLSGHPLMPTLLQTIHKQLKADPENMTLLSEEEIQVVVCGLSKQVGVEIVTAMVKPGGGGKSLKKLTVDDL